MGQGMHIGTLIYCFPVQGDRCKSRDNGVGVGAETTAGEGGLDFLNSAPLTGSEPRLGLAWAAKLEDPTGSKYAQGQTNG